MLLAGCQNDQSPKKASGQDQSTSVAETQNPLNAFVFADVTGDAPPVPEALGLLQAQVTLDRAGYSTGVLDGKDSQRWKGALKGFQKAKGLKENGTLDLATKAVLSDMTSVPATRLVRIPAGFAQQTFLPDFPKDAAE